MKRFVFVAAIVVAGSALAHDGVKNPAVLARMEGMKKMGGAAKILGEMVKGAVAFDAASANAAMETLRVESARIEALFEAEEDDPKSEAVPAIWQNYPDFTAKAEALNAAASGSVGTLTDLQGVISQIGGACRACHKGYRE